MGTIKNYYLIDYENVHEGGLSGYGELGKTDHVVIFYTQNAKKIDMNSISSRRKPHLKMINVEPGKQSADMHIISYLGYLLGKYGENCNIIIVSKDKDYDNVVKSWKKRFWKQRENISVLRTDQINNIPEQYEKALNKKKAELYREELRAVKKSGFDKKKAELYQEVLQAVKKSGFDESIANTVAKLATQMYGHEYMLDEMVTALKERYNDYRDVYASVKPILLKYTEDNNSMQYPRNFR